VEVSPVTYENRCCFVGFGEDEAGHPANPTMYHSRHLNASMTSFGSPKGRPWTHHNLQRGGSVNWLSSSRGDPKSL